MNAHMNYFLIDLVINLIIVLIYFVWKLIAIFVLHKKDASKGLFIRLVVMLLCPLAGAFYFGVSYLTYKVFMHKDVDLSDVVFGKEKVKDHLRSDEERVRNLAPMEEMLAVSDQDSQRRMMLNVLHGNLKETLGAVAEGLGSDDSETAHYAASILQSELNIFRSRMNRDQQAIEAVEDPEDKAALRCALFDYMIHFLDKRLLNPMEHRSYTMDAHKIAQDIWDYDPSRIDGLTCEQLCLRLTELSEFELGLLWCNRMQQIYPNMLGTYKARLKLFYTMGESERFLDTMEALRKSDVIIDSETLDMIRAFM